MIPGARHSGKGKPMDPFSGAVLAKGAIAILQSLASPIVGLIRGKWARRKVRKAIQRASADFVKEHPETAAAMAASANPIAQDLADLRAGRPLEPKRLAKHWVSEEYLEADVAQAYAGQFARMLHTELLKIEGFSDLFKAGTGVATVEAVQRIEGYMEDSKARALAGEEQQVAVLYFQAASQYVDAAVAVAAGDDLGAEALVDRAETLIVTARLNRETLTLMNSKDVRDTFTALVEDRFEDVEAASVAGDRAATDAAVRWLVLGAKEFRAFVSLRLRER
jgi:hypothetical protein